MDVEGSSGQHFPNWDAAYEHYSAHYHKGCIHVLRSSTQSSATPPRSTTPDSITTNPRKKKSKTVKSATASSATSKRSRRRRKSSNSSAGDYGSMYEDDDPVPPAIAPPPAATPPAFAEAFSPGTAVNPIEVLSNLPTPAGNQKTPKHRNRLQGPGFAGLSPITPTPATAPPTHTTRPLVYVCDCSDEAGGYSASRAPSRKRKATIAITGKSDTSVKRKATSTQFSAAPNMASSSTSQVIEILTESEDETDIRPLPNRICECLRLHLQTRRFSSPTHPDLNPDTSIDVDGIPEVPHGYPLTQA